MYLYLDYGVEVGKSLSCLHVACGILVKVDVTQPIDRHMYSPEDHLSVWLLFSALSLLPADLGYTEVPR